jgi:hypothetical protein
MAALVPRPARVLLVTVLLVTWAAFAVLGAGCGGPPPATPPVAGPRAGTAAPPPPPSPSATPPVPSAEEQSARVEDERRKGDAEAHRLLDAFEGQVFVAARELGLRDAAGTLRVVVDGREGEYAVAFDASRKRDEQVAVTPVREEAGIHPGAAKQAKRFAILALQGPGSFVISHAPAGSWYVQLASDGKRLVVSPIAPSGFSASYRLDDAGLVAMSGWTDGKSPTRTAFRWSWRAGPKGFRAFLDEAVEDDGKARLEFAYAEDPSLPLLERAVLTEGTHRFEAVLRFDKLGRGP